jgi:S1-C subfamily serine protease
MGHGEQNDEPLDEGPEDEHAPRGAVPNPLDRVWVHPTELPNLPPGVAPRKVRPSLARRSRRLIAPTFAGMAGALVTVIVLALAGALDRPPTSNTRPLVSGPQVPGGDSAQQVAARIGLSVVTVAARDSTGSRFGSGVCVRHAGEVLTTSRLVGNAKAVDILTSDGQRHAAHVIGRDRTTDLVLLGIDAGANVPAAQLADRVPSVGTSVWVMGATTSGGSWAWMSEGLLSSVDAVVVAKGGPATGGLLETDAASGSAGIGGALVDEHGDVTGIVLGRLDNSMTTYAMPIDTAVDIAEELHDDGVATHGSAGMTIVDGPQGPTVTTVTPGGPAAKAGVKFGDVVSSVDDQPVESKTDVMRITANYAPSRIVEFEVIRRGTEYKLRVTLESVNG